MEKELILPGCYLLIIVAEPICEDHKERILQRVAKGLLSWDTTKTQCDLKEIESVLQNIRQRSGFETEILLQHSTEKLAVEVLMNPQIFTLKQCLKNLLLSPTGHKHIIHAGYSFTGTGSWMLEDGVFGFQDFVDAFQDNSVENFLGSYPNGLFSLHIHCAPVGQWIINDLKEQNFSKFIKVELNPPDSCSGVQGAAALLDYFDESLTHLNLESKMTPTEVVGNIRFNRPTLYVFPSGQGDCSLFGITGFTMLIDGGFTPIPSFWNFIRHLERLDAIMVTRLSEDNLWGVSSLFKKKILQPVYPQIGYIFCNIAEGKSESDKKQSDSNELLVSVIGIGHEFLGNLKQVGLSPLHCLREPLASIEPMTLYHKVGHGTLQMYILSPPRDNRILRDFISHWNSRKESFSLVRTGSASQKGSDVAIPLSNLMSICCLLVWRPYDENDTIARMLFPGSAPQSRIFEGLEKIEKLDILQQQTCTKALIKLSTSLEKKNMRNDKSSKFSRFRSASPTSRTKPIYEKQQSVEIEKGDSSDTSSSPKQKRIKPQQLPLKKPTTKVVPKEVTKRVTPTPKVEQQKPKSDKSVVNRSLSQSPKKRVQKETALKNGKTKQTKPQTNGSKKEIDNISTKTDETDDEILKITLTMNGYDHKNELNGVQSKDIVEIVEEKRKALESEELGVENKFLHAEYLKDEIEPDSLESIEQDGRGQICKDSLEVSEDEIAVDKSESKSECDIVAEQVKDKDQQLPLKDNKDLSQITSNESQEIIKEMQKEECADKSGVTSLSTLSPMSNVSFPDSQSDNLPERSSLLEKEKPSASRILETDAESTTQTTIAHEKDSQIETEVDKKASDHITQSISSENLEIKSNGEDSEQLSDATVLEVKSKSEERKKSLDGSTVIAADVDIPSSDSNFGIDQTISTDEGQKQDDTTNVQLDSLDSNISLKSDELHESEASDLSAKVSQLDTKSESGVTAFQTESTTGVEKSDKTDKTESTTELEISAETEEAKLTTETEKNDKTDKTESTTELEISAETDEAKLTTETEKSDETDKTKSRSATEKSDVTAFETKSTSEIEKDDETDKTKSTTEIEISAEKDKIKSTTVIETSSETDQIKSTTEIEKSDGSDKIKSTTETEISAETYKTKSMVDLEKSGETDKIKPTTETEISAMTDKTKPTAEIEKSDETDKIESITETEISAETDKAELTTETEKSDELDKFKSTTDTEKSSESDKTKFATEVEESDETDKAKAMTETEISATTDKTKPTADIEKSGETDKTKSTTETEKSDETDKTKFTAEVEKNGETDKAKSITETEISATTDKTKPTTETEKSDETDKTKSTIETEKSSESDKPKFTTEVEKSGETDKAKSMTETEISTEADKTKSTTEIEKSSVTAFETKSITEMEKSDSADKSKYPTTASIESDLDFESNKLLAESKLQSESRAMTDESSKGFETFQSVSSASVNSEVSVPKDKSSEIKSQTETEKHIESVDTGSKKESDASITEWSQNELATSLDTTKIISNVQIKDEPLESKSKIMETTFESPQTIIANSEQKLEEKTQSSVSNKELNYPSTDLNLEKTNDFVDNKQIETNVVKDELKSTLSQSESEDVKGRTYEVDKSSENASDLQELKAFKIDSQPENMQVIESDIDFDTHELKSNNQIDATILANKGSTLDSEKDQDKDSKTDQNTSKLITSEEIKASEKTPKSSVSDIESSAADVGTNALKDNQKVDATSSSTLISVTDNQKEISKEITPGKESQSEAELMASYEKDLTTSIDSEKRKDSKEANDLRDDKKDSIKSESTHQSLLGEESILGKSTDSKKDSISDETRVESRETEAQLFETKLPSQLQTEKVAKLVESSKSLDQFDSKTLQKNEKFDDKFSKSLDEFDSKTLQKSEQIDEKCSKSNVESKITSDKISVLPEISEKETSSITKCSITEEDIIESEKFSENKSTKVVGSIESDSETEDYSEHELMQYESELRDRNQTTVKTIDQSKLDESDFSNVKFQTQTNFEELPQPSEPSGAKKPELKESKTDKQESFALESSEIWKLSESSDKAENKIQTIGDPSSVGFEKRVSEESSAKLESKEEKVDETFYKSSVSEKIEVESPIKKGEIHKDTVEDSWPKSPKSEKPENEGSSDTKSKEEPKEQSVVKGEVYQSGSESIAFEKPLSDTASTNESIACIQETKGRIKDPIDLNEISISCKKEETTTRKDSTTSDNDKSETSKQAKSDIILSEVKSESLSSGSSEKTSDKSSVESEAFNTNIQKGSEEELFSGNKVSETGSIEKELYSKQDSTTSAVCEATNKHVVLSQQNISEDKLNSQKSEELVKDEKIIASESDKKAMASSAITKDSEIDREFDGHKQWIVGEDSNVKDVSKEADSEKTKQKETANLKEFQNKNSEKDWDIDRNNKIDTYNKDITSQTEIEEMITSSSAIDSQKQKQSLRSFDDKSDDFFKSDEEKDRDFPEMSVSMTTSHYEEEAEFYFSNQSEDKLRYQSEREIETTVKLENNGNKTSETLDTNLYGKSQNENKGLDPITSEVKANQQQTKVLSFEPADSSKQSLESDRLFHIGQGVEYTTYSDVYQMPALSQKTERETDIDKEKSRSDPMWLKDEMHSQTKQYESIIESKESNAAVAVKPSEDKSKFELSQTRETGLQSIDSESKVEQIKIIEKTDDKKTASESLSSKTDKTKQEVIGSSHMSQYDMRQQIIDSSISKIDSDTKFSVPSEIFDTKPASDKVEHSVGLSVIDKESKISKTESKSDATTKLEDNKIELKQEEKTETYLFGDKFDKHPTKLTSEIVDLHPTNIHLPSTHIRRSSQMVEQPLYEDSDEEDIGAKSSNKIIEQSIESSILVADYPEMITVSGGTTPSPSAPQSPYDSKSISRSESLRHRDKASTISTISEDTDLEIISKLSDDSRTDDKKSIDKAVEKSKIEQTVTIQKSEEDSGKDNKAKCETESQKKSSESKSDLKGESFTSIEKDVIVETITSSSGDDLKQKPTQSSGSAISSLDKSSEKESKSKEVTEKEIVIIEATSSSDNKFDVEKWGKPLNLPTPPDPVDSQSKSSNKVTAKKATNVTSTNPAPKIKHSTNKPTKSNGADSISPVYVDLAYVPNHADQHYCNSEYFQRVRARYYVFSGINPHREVFEALIQGKKTWDKQFPTTVIPTHESEALGFWISMNQDLLTEYKIDVAPSANRCTVNLQDHETKCSAYRVEF